MRRLAVLLIAVTLVIAGCGHPLLPAASADPETAALLGASEWPVLGETQPVLGVDLYAQENYTPAQVEAYGRRTLGYIKNVLKANAVGIVWTFISPDPYEETIETTNATLSAANVGILTRIANQDHLLVEYRPLILVQDSPSKWEGQISPYLAEDWFNSYYRAELPYLRIAQHLGVREFVTATELTALNTSTLWPSFFARVARIYHGVISYGAWDGNYFGVSPGASFQEATPQLLPVKYLGMDMYWHMNLQASATSAQVTEAWEGLFAKVPSSVLRRTAIDETGIQARAGAYPNPQALDQPGLRSEQVQVNWFTAACKTVQRYHMRGVFFFKVDLTDNPAHPATSLSTFEGRQGAQAISDCARILY
jgi:hypothetical protein